ncbi:T9SS type A sorting domain-containing protein [Taibaiella chishuiensis]|uniref:Putative secreted protein (Por secretion system target) n=1 Tax=Taibaiella chishuiensis TaxID=1434707 RepID=A0A2P8CYK8_9BACT|nr:T9SS type A sorting domain-containing protein [Taibaiella chishuiensis]PSK90055.1 putative secreted protein (Por secretion system target) [Taibaiella chishuiensis]
MKKVLQSFLVAGVLLVAASTESYAQPTVDLTLTGSPNLGTYTGIGIAGTFGLTFQNPSTTNLLAGAFQIVLTVPTGIQFDATYPGTPPGWTYTRTSLQSALLVPTAQVVGIIPSVPASIVVFNVPFTTTQAVTAQTYSAQIQRTGLPQYNDPNPNNNSPTGTVSVTVPLAITFESFEVSAKGCQAILSWATSFERNNEYFNVERSVNGVDFEAIGKVKSAGSGAVRRTYSYVDAHPQHGKNLYRIVQVNTDRSTSVTPTRDLSFDCKGPGVELYPNPAKVKLYVKGLKGKNTIRVFNALGQQVLERTTELAVYELDVHGLAAAVYQIQVSDATDIVYSGKFLKGE